jgi:hypothetical protein
MLVLAPPILLPEKGEPGSVGPPGRQGPHGIQGPRGSRGRYVCHLDNKYINIKYNYNCSSIKF